VTDIGNALRINVSAGDKQVDSPAKVHFLLHFDGDLLLV